MSILHESLDPYDEHNWWIFDSRLTSPNTCELCQALDGTHYRGDELELAFPWHVPMRVNAIRAMVHVNCRCVLRWAGASIDVLASPYGMKQKVDRPETPEDLSPSQQFGFRQVTKHAREMVSKKLRVLK